MELSAAQKEALADQITKAEPHVLNKALEIIARTQNVATVSQLREAIRSELML